MHAATAMITPRLRPRAGSTAVSMTTDCGAAGGPIGGVGGGFGVGGVCWTGWPPGCTGHDLGAVNVGVGVVRYGGSTGASGGANGESIALVYPVVCAQRTRPSQSLLRSYLRTRRRAADCGCPSSR